MVPRARAVVRREFRSDRQGAPALRVFRHEPLRRLVAAKSILKQVLVAGLEAGEIIVHLNQRFRVLDFLRERIRVRVPCRCVDIDEMLRDPAPRRFCFNKIVIVRAVGIASRCGQFI